MANVFDNIVGTEHIVAESSLLKATTTGHIYSLKMHADTDNGCIVSRGAVAEMQVFNSKEYKAGAEPLLVLTPPLGYNSDRKHYQDEKYFYNAKNEVARAYELHVGDIFTVSANAITALSEKPVVGNYVKVTSGKYDEVALASSATIAGLTCKIIEEVNYTNSKSYRLLVVDLNHTAGSGSIEA